MFFFLRKQEKKIVSPNQDMIHILRVNQFCHQEQKKRRYAILISAFHKLHPNHKYYHSPPISTIIDQFLVPYITTLNNGIFAENLSWPQKTEVFEFIHTEQILDRFYRIKNLFTDSDLLFLMGEGCLCTYSYFMHQSMENRIRIYNHIHSQLLVALTRKTF